VRTEKRGSLVFGEDSKGFGLEKIQPDWWEIGGEGDYQERVRSRGNKVRGSRGEGEGVNRWGEKNEKVYQKTGVSAFQAGAGGCRRDLAKRKARRVLRVINVRRI